MAENERGSRTLIKLISPSYLDGFYYNPRMNKDLLRQHHEGALASAPATMRVFSTNCSEDSSRTRA
ncbi:PHP domain-containing protein [Nitrospira sp. NS4]|uniref:PHP domain-containing protein n=1 Tax=Nitrospira sp. NS4 TaxID=3414498 RepID=UPI003C2F9C79